MKFTIEAGSCRTEKELVYRPEEFSFDTEPSASDGFTSLLINDVQLEVDSDGVVAAVWGLCPYLMWIDSVVTAPSNATSGTLRVSEPSELVPGVGIRLCKERQAVFGDSTSGWIRIGQEAEEGALVEIFSGAVVQLTKGGEFGCIWLKPSNYPVA
ncbi:hypothetical protein ABIE59_001102 [Marinobacter sp. MBR-99]|uniref:hypothetical protein n=1 Tax=Marinobacter sp. MBR-99 TaxID=3156461 RepID=UPI00339AFDCA